MKQKTLNLLLSVTGNIPWQKADKLSDPKYQTFDFWTKSQFSRTPKPFKILSSKARRLFRKLLDPNPSKRPINLGDEISKFGDDKWLSKVPEKPSDFDELNSNMSMLSFHSSLTDKNRLLATLTRFGVETTVDRNLKKDRIKEWIQTSTIEEEGGEEEEEDEEGEEETASSSKKSY